MPNNNGKNNTIRPPKPISSPPPRTQPPTHKIYPNGKKTVVISSSKTSPSKPKPSPKPNTSPSSKTKQKVVVRRKAMKMPSETQLRKDWNESAGGRRAGISYTDFMLAERKRRGYRNQMDK
jgi:hypothetical protein